MAVVPFLKVYCSDFFGDPNVAQLSPEARGIYVLLLMRMWMNGGWIANDDRIIARTLGLTPTTWRRHYRPALEKLLISREFPQICGGILTQKRLERDWATTARTMASNKEKMAKVRAEKDGKSKQRHPPADNDDAPVARTEHNGAADTVDSTMHKHSEALSTSGIPEPDKKGRRAASQPSAAGPVAIVPVGSLRPMPLAEVERPTDPALVGRLVSAGLKRSKATGLMAALEKRDDDD